MSKKLLLWGGGLLGGAFLVRSLWSPSISAQAAAPGRLDGASTKHGFVLQYPFPNATYERVTQAYGRITSDTRGERDHEGIDIRCKLGTPIYAAGPGVVVFAQCDPVRTFYGNFVVVKHLTADGRPVFCRYAHVKEFRVQAMQSVDKSTVLALSGGRDHPCTGNSDGEHLHMEVAVLKNDRDHTRDPVLFFDHTRPTEIYTSGARMPVDQGAPS